MNITEKPAHSESRNCRQKNTLFSHWANSSWIKLSWILCTCMAHTACSYIHVCMCACVVAWVPVRKRETDYTSAFVNTHKFATSWLDLPSRTVYNPRLETVVEHQQRKFGDDSWSVCDFVDRKRLTWAGGHAHTRMDSTSISPIHSVWQGIIINLCKNWIAQDIRTG